MDKNNKENIDKKILESEISLKNQMNNGLNWFYWIAALSIINSLLFVANTDLSFIAGLGITQIIDGFINELPKVKNIGIIINGIFIIGFILLGKFSKKSNALIIVGIIIYSLDTLIFLFVSDWFSFGFHIFAIIGIIYGFKAKLKLSKLQNINISENNINNNLAENTD
jgi:hypothetical protein